MTFHIWAWCQRNVLFPRHQTIAELLILRILTRGSCQLRLDRWLLRCIQILPRFIVKSGDLLLLVDRIRYGDSLRAQWYVNWHFALHQLNFRLIIKQKEPLLLVLLCGFRVVECLWIILTTHSFYWLRLLWHGSLRLHELMLDVRQLLLIEVSIANRWH